MEFCLPFAHSAARVGVLVPRRHKEPPQPRKRRLFAGTHSRHTKSWLRSRLSDIFCPAQVLPRRVSTPNAAHWLGREVG